MPLTRTVYRSTIADSVWSITKEEKIKAEQLQGLMYVGNIHIMEFSKEFLQKNDLGYVKILVGLAKSLLEKAQKELTAQNFEVIPEAKERMANIMNIEVRLPVFEFDKHLHQFFDTIERLDLLPLPFKEDIFTYFNRTYLEERRGSVLLSIQDLLLPIDSYTEHNRSTSCKESKDVKESLEITRIHEKAFTEACQIAERTLEKQIQIRERQRGKDAQEQQGINSAKEIDEQLQNQKENQEIQAQLSKALNHFLEAGPTKENEEAMTWIFCEMAGLQESLNKPRLCTFFSSTLQNFVQVLKNQEERLKGLQALSSTSAQQTLDAQKASIETLASRIHALLKKVSEEEATRQKLLSEAEQKHKAAEAIIRDQLKAQEEASTQLQTKLAKDVKQSQDAAAQLVAHNEKQEEELTKLREAKITSDKRNQELEQTIKALREEMARKVASSSPVLLSGGPAAAAANQATVIAPTSAASVDASPTANGSSTTTETTASSTNTSQAP